VKERLRAHFAATLRDLHERLCWWTPRCAGRARDAAARGGNVLLVAFGKAARPMARSLLDVLPAARVRGLLVPPQADGASLPPLEVIPGGHPLPDAGSFRAATRALELCRGVRDDDHVVFLVSGGGSAMLELPLDATIDVAAWRAFYQALVGCGAPIDRMNAIRRRLSMVKGGRLAVAADAAADQMTIVVSDVPGPVDDVASGPTGDFTDAADTLLNDLTEFGLMAALPLPLRHRAQQGAIPALPEQLGPGRKRAWATVLEEGDARRAFAGHLADEGLFVDQEADADGQTVEAAAEQLLARLERMAANHVGRAIAIVTTGELSVPLPTNPGIGGRNQQFVLACARLIRGQPITVLSAGTDGIDGNSPAAGALADGTTVARAGAAGFDVHDALARCDAYPLLHALGDTIVTGPTGTNVRDLRILVHHG
jgi:glycerate 2-kinase